VHEQVIAPAGSRAEALAREIGIDPTEADRHGDHIHHEIGPEHRHIDPARRKEENAADDEDRVEAVEEEPRT
jgi:hypothetical protein